MQTEAEKNFSLGLVEVQNIVRNKHCRVLLFSDEKIIGLDT